GLSGIAEPLEIGKTLETARTLHPGTRQVWIVNDMTETGVANKKRILEAVPFYANSLSFVFLENVTRTELEQTLGNLPADSIVLFFAFSRDRNGEFFEADEGLKIVTNSSVRPVYSLWDYTLGKGVVGGMLLRGRDHGTATGRMMMTRLSGAETEQSGDAGNQSSYMFDFTKLRQFGIRTGDLPAGSIVINEPASIFAFSWYLWGSIGVATVLICIIVLLLFNISKRQQAEEHVRENEEKFRGITQRAFEMIYTADPSGIITYVNPAVQKITGYAPNDLLGQNIQKVLQESEQPGIQRVLRSVMKGANIDDYEMKIIRKDGSTAITENNFSPIVENGEIVGIQGAARDITEKKEAELLKKKAFQQIEKNIEQFQILNDQLRNPLAVIIGLSDLQDSEAARQILQQAWQINEIITKLDKGCLESDKVRAYLRKQYEKE
ncbi:MAG: PAS domain S-box protein, partial [Methanomicrobiales archaeon]|nr:PAS domain S-box protein [Methanomicrobiales archaeon]